MQIMAHRIQTRSAVSAARSSRAIVRPMAAMKQAPMEEGVSKRQMLVGLSTLAAVAGLAVAQPAFARDAGTGPGNDSGIGDGKKGQAGPSGRVDATEATLEMERTRPAVFTREPKTPAPAGTPQIPPVQTPVPPIPSAPNSKF